MGKLVTRTWLLLLLPAAVFFFFFLHLLLLHIKVYANGESPHHRVERPALIFLNSFRQGKYIRQVFVF